MAGWLARGSDGNVLEELVFSNLTPGTTEIISISFEYRGFRPTKVYGFYLRPIAEPLYEGSNNPIIDPAELIRWADEYTLSPAMESENPGMEISQTDPDGLAVITQVKSGTGDAEWSYLEYVGHQGGYVRLGDRVSLGIRITTPLASNKEISKAARYHFLLDIIAEEVNFNLVDILLPEGEC